VEGIAKLIGIVLVAFIGFTIYSSTTPPSNLEGQTAVEATKPKFHFWKGAGDSSGTYEITDKNTRAVLGTYDTDSSGYLYQRPEQQKTGKLGISYTPELYFGEFTADFGIWGGAAPGAEHVGQAGIRFSPCRLGFGSIAAPDIIVSRDIIGGGISCYTPKGWGPAWTTHFGLGLWYGAAYDDSWRGPIFGLSFSTK
jgi:hypothetical protein